ncbi:hypothetical protein Tco_1123272 [Tanacetum coccineum]|uniref:Uncharacterized protein n=1 Tax=Tanacetum coccineum TaxID=301880 RepID=A0ABQ5J5P9_9ASTR
MLKELFNSSGLSLISQYKSLEALPSLASLPKAQKSNKSRPLGADMASPILSVHHLNDWKRNISRWITSYLTWIASLAIRD